ncbi:glycosyltransferase family 4 protein [Vibrio cholerae]|uniref:glycosyltransferase family 4 protein n=1 Tax=Vibrio cholerae TaxID=666 RepID=UPI000E69681F|nr:glycosyltransferase family 4 protein [Vibrio cholerae]EGR1063823.1 glycosyltransferase [Vibrio cholerae]EGR4203245.1 glycosyltransferase [Vibrio cholerae]EMC9265404.1 glycosyltransferase family 4 protein [Vibrio cholerae]EMC9387495.1 glycosyltransferase family 4 protein [Vibrio cholerae]HDI3272171.1 glycosyltransferase family 4 protein [Vibrio cholerae]
MSNIYLFDQFGAGGLYSGPGNYFFNLISANADEENSFHLVHGHRNQQKSDVFKSVNFISDTGSPISNAVYSYKVGKFVKRKDIDIIQTTHAYFGSISAAKAGISKGVPTYLRIAKSNSELSNRSKLSKLLNLSKKKIDVLKLSSGVVAISQEIKSELLSLGVQEEIIHYIPNGVDLRRFNRNHRHDNIKMPFGNDHIVIGFCGAIIDRKRPHLLLETLRLLSNDYVACFIGPYDLNSIYVQEMMNYINKNNLTNRVFFTGYIKNPEVYLAKCDYFCLPSMNEGMPNSLLEAMASKCIPISTNISGVTDIINDSDVGFIVDPSASCIVDVIKNTVNYRNKYAQSAYNRIVCEFSATSAYNKYLNMYKSSRP